MKGEGEGNKATYIEHIGLFFFFVACAGVSIIVWVFNWICWRNQCCCCDFLHNPINKRIVWWTCFIFLLGLLACCISGFVTTNRFGFALEGSYCSFERFYYDSIYGQLNETYPRWEGFGNMANFLNKLSSFIGNLSTDKLEDLNDDYTFYEYKQTFLKSYTENCIESNNNCNKTFNFTLPFMTRYEKILDAYRNLLNVKKNGVDGLSSYFNNMLGDFENIKSKFLNKFYYFARIANGWGRVLTMIYFCLLLIAVTFAGFSMMFYVCLRNQGYLAIFMHVLWNIIRFFIFSFFFYGAAYGMCYLALRDAVAYVMFFFGEENLNGDGYLLPKEKGREFLQICLSIDKDNTYKNKLDDILIFSLEDIIKNSKELNDSMESCKVNDDYLVNDGFKLENGTVNFVKFIINNINDNFFNIANIKTLINDLGPIAVRQGGLFGSFDCSFLRSDLAMMYRTLYDLSVEARILCALSCCIGFFGAIAVYFFLLVLHHYNMDLFFDSGQSIFTTIDGNPRRKKNSSKDPGYKKRKIRSEIELSSRNEEYSGVNKNDD